ncbi:DVU0150 family protein [Desulfovibrio aminophilus]|uniref:DVU0150 family protein n=1 Tax=Desulfovibrio aminophilus TaxID=81425 RepID=UPI0004171CE5|nr:DVU0150 family protein [Desulfovibrio aminophilus]
MLTRTAKVLPLILALLAVLPQLVWAAGGGASELVVVADTRVVKNVVLHYFADLYNMNMLLNAIWAVVLTAGYGGFLGFLMDFIISRCGLDLTKRSIVEH